MICRGTYISVPMMFAKRGLKNRNSRMIFFPVQQLFILFHS